MQQTENLKLNLIEGTDAVDWEVLNENIRKVENQFGVANTALQEVDTALTQSLAAAQATGNRGLVNLKKLAYDLCQLAYQQDGAGTYTGFKKNIAFDGLNTDHQVESTTGAAVLEPDNGRIRLAVDGWSGGSIPWTSRSLSVPAAETGFLLTEEWSPAGNATLNTVTVTGKISNGVTTSVLVSIVLMRGETELATSSSGSIPKNSGNTTTLSLSFPDETLVKAEETYRLKIVVKNGSGNTDQVATISGSSIPITATAVRCTEGSFTTSLLSLEGQDITVWVQASESAAVTAEVELSTGWAAMTLGETRDSQTPEGAACQEQIFNLALAQPPSGVRLRFRMESETECMIYGYGAVAV